MSRLGDVSKSTLRERRRFAWRRWRGRMLAWRYVLLGLGLVLVGGLLLWVLEFHGFGGLADVKKVDIVGANRTITSAMIEKAARLPVGDSLVSANLSEIRSRVLNDPSLHNAISSADVSREWPDTIKIVVTMRTPVAMVPIGNGKGSLDTCDVLDRNGNLFGNFEPVGGACPSFLSALPIVQPTTATDGESPYAQAAGVAAQLPARLRALVKYIAVPSPDGVQLVLKGDASRQINDGTTVVWGSADDTPRKAQELAALLKANPGAHGYDVSVVSAPAAQP